MGGRTRESVIGRGAGFATSPFVKIMRGGKKVSGSYIIIVQHNTPTQAHSDDYYWY